MNGVLENRLCKISHAFGIWRGDFLVAELKISTRQKFVMIAESLQSRASCVQIEQSSCQEKIKFFSEHRLFSDDVEVRNNIRSFFWNVSNVNVPNGDSLKNFLTLSG